MRRTLIDQQTHFANFAKVLNFGKVVFNYLTTHNRLIASEKELMDRLFRKKVVVKSKKDRI